MLTFGLRRSYHRRTCNNDIHVIRLHAPLAIYHVVQEYRMQTVATLVSAVQDLMEELKISASTALDNRILGSLAIPSSNGTPVLQSTEVHSSRIANRQRRSLFSTLILLLLVFLVFITQANIEYLVPFGACFTAHVEYCT